MLSRVRQHPNVLRSRFVPKSILLKVYTHLPLYPCPDERQKLELVSTGLTEADFGRYIANVCERDIDLLLVEEFHISDDFVDWFCGEIGLTGVSFDGAWHSLSDTDGETDILLRVAVDGHRIGILIENKVGAPEQELQAERYHLRGSKAQKQGKLDSYVTVMCAPSGYLAGLSPESAYQRCVSYESIAEWYCRQAGRRASWRHRVMLNAIDHGRRGYTMTVNTTVTSFHLAYWEHLQKWHPRIKMARPKNRGGKSTWIILKGHDFPKGVHLHHKLDQRTMELGFDSQMVEDIAARNSAWPNDLILLQKGRTATIAINIPHIDVNLGFEAQLPAVEDALKAAYRLIPYATIVQPHP